MEMPAFASDGGEEPEVAGVYIIAATGEVRRVGLVLANEFSDHEFEEKNYLYLAHLKTADISLVRSWWWARSFRMRVERWNHSWRVGFLAATIRHRGKEHVAHGCEPGASSLKYPAHRRPGDAHVYFFGADAFSFGEGVRLQDGDVMEIELEGFGRSLRNPLRVDKSKPELVRVRPL